MIAPGGIDIIGAGAIGLAICGVLLWAAAHLFAAIEREIDIFFAFNGAWSAERRDGGGAAGGVHAVASDSETTGANSGKAESFAAHGRAAPARPAVRGMNGGCDG